MSNSTTNTKNLLRNVNTQAKEFGTFYMKLHWAIIPKTSINSWENFTFFLRAIMLCFATVSLRPYANEYHSHWLASLIVKSLQITLGYKKHCTCFPPFSDTTGCVNKLFADWLARQHFIQMSRLSLIFFNWKRDWDEYRTFVTIALHNSHLSGWPVRIHVYS